MKACQIVVPLYAELHTLFLESLYLLKEVTDILLVENDPTKSRAQFFEQELDIEYLPYQENNVYRAWNLGVDVSNKKKYKYTIVSSTDIYLNPSIVLKFISALQDRSFVCSYQFFDNPAMHPYLSHQQFQNQIMSFVPFAVRPKAQYDCFAIRNSLLDEIGVFNEECKVYFGDTDFTLRMRERDIEPVQYTSLKVLHMSKTDFSTHTLRQCSVEETTRQLQRDAEVFVSLWDHKWEWANKEAYKYMRIHLTALKLPNCPFNSEEYYNNELLVRAIDQLG